MILEISVSQLSFGMRGDDVARVHRALQALGRNVPAAEQKERLLGAETVARIKALQADLGLPASGIIDAATVRHLNIELSKLATGPRVVRGTVRDASGNPFSGGFVQIFRQSPSGETPLGNSALAPADGSYKISYELPPGSNGRADLRVAVLNNAGPLETIPSAASILPDAGPLEVVDFVLSGDTNRPSSEFELISGDLKPLLGNRHLADLNEEGTHRDVSILANQSAYSADQIADLVLAHKLEKETTKRGALFYAMLRQGLPKNALALHAANPDTRLNALKTSVGQGLVQSEINGKKIEDHLAEFVPPHANELRGLLGSILNADELNKFTTEYLQNSQDPARFWAKLSTDPALSNRARTLEFIAQLAGLSNNHSRLIDEVRARQDLRQASDLVRLSKDDWKRLIQTQGVGVPAETPGANPKNRSTTTPRRSLPRWKLRSPPSSLPNASGLRPSERFSSPSPPSISTRHTCRSSSKMFRLQAKPCRRKTSVSCNPFSGSIA